MLVGPVARVFVFPLGRLPDTFVRRADRGYRLCARQLWVGVKSIVCVGAECVISHPHACRGGLTCRSRWNLRVCQRKHHGARDANLALRDVEQLGFPRVTSGRDDTVRLSQFLRAEHLPTPLYFIFSTSTQDLAFGCWWWFLVLADFCDVA